MRDLLTWTRPDTFKFRLECITRTRFPIGSGSGVGACSTSVDHRSSARIVTQRPLAPLCEAPVNWNDLTSVVIQISEIEKEIQLWYEKYSIFMNTRKHRFFYTSSDVFLSWFFQTRRFEITIFILLQIFTLAYWVNSKLLIFFSYWHLCWHLLKQSFCSELSPSSQYFPSSLGRGLVQVLVRMRWFPAQIPAAQPLHADQPDQPPFTFKKE